MKRIFSVFEINLLSTLHKMIENIVWENLGKIEQWIINFFCETNNFFRRCLHFGNREISFVEVIILQSTNLLHSHSNDKTENYFMLIEQSLRYVQVNSFCNLLYEIINSFLNCFSCRAHFHLVHKNSWKILQWKLVHRLNVWKFWNYYIQNSTSVCNWLINTSCFFNLFTFNDTFLKTFFYFSTHFFGFFEIGN